MHTLWIAVAGAALAAPALASSARLVELTGDALPDKLVLGPAGHVAVEVNLGHGRFAPVDQDLPRVAVVDWLADDLDGDGLVDLYLVSPGDDVVLRGLGGGRFVDATELLGFGGDGVGLAVERVELDGVAPADLLLHDAAGDVIFWARGARFEPDASAAGHAGAVLPAAGDTEEVVASPGGTPGAGPSAGTTGASVPRSKLDDMLPAALIGIFDERYVNDDQGEVDVNDLAASSVTDDDIAPGAVTESALAFGAVTSDAVLDGSLTGFDVQNGSLTGADIGAGAIGTAQVADGALQGADVSTSTGSVSHLNADFTVRGALATPVFEHTGGGTAVLGSRLGFSSSVPWDLRDDSPTANNAKSAGVLWVSRANMSVDGAGTGLHFRGLTATGATREYGGISASIDAGLSANVPVEGSLRFYTTSNGFERFERMAIRSDGNVGIGVSDPESTLVVNGDTIVAGAGRLGVGVSDPQDDLHVFGDTLLQGDAVVQDGQLGIGVPDPTEALDVLGDVKVSGDVLAGFGSSGQPSFRFGTGTEDTGMSSPAFEELALITSTAERVRITQSGDVGIGTSGPVSELHVPGTITAGFVSKGAGTFQIDHPLDPTRKFLSHSFVESPDMMNIYNGNVVLDGSGEAVVQLPDWFEALNRDMRYQLTTVGGFAPVFVAEEVRDGRFTIAGGFGGLVVSWQVTGVRQDAYAEAHRVQVERPKVGVERGRYLHPLEHGQPASRGIEHALRAEARAKAAKRD